MAEEITQRPGESQADYMYRKYGVGAPPKAPQPQAPQAPQAPQQQTSTMEQARRNQEEKRRSVNYADGGLVQPQNFINAVGYADGGMVGLQPAAPTNFMNAVGYQNGGGIGMPTSGGSSYASDPSMVDAHINDGFTKNPQVREQIKQIVMEAVQSGELTPQELNQIIQLAKAAQHNPGIWPQLRNFILQQGADPSEIPEQYDQGLVSLVLIIAKAVEQDLSQGTAGATQPGMQPPMQMKANGGLIVGPGTGTSDSVPAVNSSDGSPVAVSNGEYVIPASVVQAKGVDFFDGLVRKYHTPNGLKK